MSWRIIHPQTTQRTAPAAIRCTKDNNGKEYLTINTKGLELLGIDIQAPQSRRQVGFAINSETRQVYIYPKSGKGFLIGRNGRITANGIRSSIELIYGGFSGVKLLIGFKPIKVGNESRYPLQEEREP